MDRQRPSFFRKIFGTVAEVGRGLADEVLPRRRRRREAERLVLLAALDRGERLALHRNERHAQDGGEAGGSRLAETASLDVRQHPTVTTPPMPFTRRARPADEETSSVNDRHAKIEDHMPITSANIASRWSAYGGSLASAERFPENERQAHTSTRNKVEQAELAYDFERRVRFTGLRGARGLKQTLSHSADRSQDDLDIRNIGEAGSPRSSISDRHEQKDVQHQALDEERQLLAERRLKRVKKGSREGKALEKEVDSVCGESGQPPGKDQQKQENGALNRWLDRQAQNAFSMRKAIREGNLQQIRELLSPRHDEQACLEPRTLNSILLDAIEYGHAPVSEWLLRAGADANAERGRRTALHAAAEGGFDTIVEALVRHKARLESWNHDGHTALELASYNGHESVVRTLAAAGAFPTTIGGKKAWPHQHSWKMDWQARKYLETEFTVQEDIRSSVVLYRGLNDNIVCTTFLDICRKSNLEHAEDVIAPLMHLTRLSSKAEASHYCYAPPFRLHCTLKSWTIDTDQVEIEIRTRDHNVIKEVEHILVLLCSALRPPPPYICRSSAESIDIGKAFTRIRLGDFIDMRLTYTKCWTALFQRKVVVDTPLRRDSEETNFFPRKIGLGILQSPRLSWLKQLAGA